MSYRSLGLKIDIVLVRHEEQLYNLVGGYILTFLKVFDKEFNFEIYSHNFERDEDLNKDSIGAILWVNKFYLPKFIFKTCFLYTAINHNLVLEQKKLYSINPKIEYYFILLKI